MKITRSSSLPIVASLSLAALVPTAASAAEDAPAKSKPATETTQPVTPKAPAAPPKAPAAPAALELKDPVAKVNGKTISAAELKQNAGAFVGRMGASLDTLPPAQQLQVYRRVLDDMVIDSLLDEKCKEIEVSDKEINESFDKLASQFPDKAAFDARLKEAGDTEADVKDAIKASLQKRNWIEGRLPKDIAPTDADAKTFYEKNIDSFKEPESVRASHILIATPADLTPEQLTEKEKLATEIKARLDKGEDFAALATEFSEDPGSKANGGDLNFFTKDRMVPEFATAAFALKKDEISAPVKSNFGYHIIKKTDAKAARDVPFDEAKPKIVEHLTESKRREAIQTLLKALQEQADVTINLPNPPAPAAPAPAAPKAPAKK